MLSIINGFNEMLLEVQNLLPTSSSNNANLYTLYDKGRLMNVFLLVLYLIGKSCSEVAFPQINRLSLVKNSHEAILYMF